MSQFELKEIDPKVPFGDQMKEDCGPVVMLVTSLVAPEDVDRVLEFYAQSATAMNSRPGFISAQVHRAIGGASVVVSYTEWRSVADLRASVQDPRIAAERERGPAATVSTVLLQKVAVPGLCSA